MRRFNWLGCGFVNVVYVLLYFGHVTAVHPTVQGYLLYGVVFNLGFVGMFLLRRRV